MISCTYLVMQTVENTPADEPPPYRELYHEDKITSGLNSRHATACKLCTPMYNSFVFANNFVLF